MPGRSPVKFCRGRRSLLAASHRRGSGRAARPWIRRGTRTLGRSGGGGGGGEKSGRIIEEGTSRRGTDASGMRIAEVRANGRGLRLRECSVVIVGSTCRICGRDFKCESDVELHTRWRHNAAMGSLMDILDREMKLGNIGQKCDVCEMSFGIVSDLKIHKRLIHKHRLHMPRQRGKRGGRKEMVRVKFKLNGVTTTDVSLDRRYIENDFGYVVDVCTQASPGSLENERPKRKDDCAGNIDLSFPNRVVDKSHMQHGIRPDKAANRYIVGKFASTKGDASRAAVVGKSLAEISNTPYKNTISENDNSWKWQDCRYLATPETTADVFVKPLADSIRDKENSPTNERERKNVHCPSEASFDDKVFLACQPEKSDRISKENSKENWSSESPHYSIRRSDESAGTKETAGLANSFIDSVELIINNEKNYGFDGGATKRLSSALSQLDGKPESIEAGSNVDDDVQEVLRITRGNTQSDINHESPNRMEREMLVQNAISNTFTLPAQLEPTVFPEKCDVAFTNFEPSDYPSFMAVTESDYQFLANSFNKKLGIYLEDLHHYGIRVYNDLPEINNNVEEYTVYAHQNVFETWKQSGEPSYTNGLKANDNEVAVVLD